MSNNINECLPITIFPMGVECVVINPTNTESSDGSATLIITGGTPPYDITWENGSKSISLVNLDGGSYSAIITDYYGDFTVNTTCVLTSPVPTTSTTTTSTTVQPLYDFCMVIDYFDYKTETDVLDNIHFNANGLVGGYQSWISDDTNYTITWNSVSNVWQLNDYGVVINTSNPAYPPLNNWQILGYHGNVNVYEGECVSVSNLSLKVNSNPSTCSNCDGIIILQGQGGVPPYQYSIDGGQIWVSNGTFQGLCPSVTYVVKVKDSTDSIYTPTIGGTIMFVQTPITTYTVSLNNSVTTFSQYSNEVNFTVNITPSLPVGVTLNFGLSLVGVFTRTPYINSANATFTSTVIKNGVPITTYNDETYDSVIPNTQVNCTQYSKYITNYKHTYQLSINSTDTYTIKTNSLYEKTCNNTPPPPGISQDTSDYYENTEINGPLKYTPPTPFTACCVATFNTTNGSYIQNLSLEGCSCCNVNTNANNFYE